MFEGMWVIEGVNFKYSWNMEREREMYFSLCLPKPLLLNGERQDTCSYDDNFITETTSSTAMVARVISFWS